MAAAVQQFGAMDGPGFQVTRDRALTLLPCLVEPLAPADVARVHGLMALDAFLRQDDAGAVNAFRAALAADPAWSLPPDLVPDGHPVRLQIQVAATLTSILPRPLPVLTPDLLLVDGVPATTAPNDRPTLLQRIAADGHVVDTAWLAAGASLPAWTAPKRVTPPSTTVATPREHHPVVLASAAGGALLASGVCYGLAFVAHDAFVNPDTARGYPDDPTALRDRANTFTWASVGAGVLGVGLGSVAVVRW